MITLLRRKGDFGEEIATKFLMKHGFVVVGKNYSKPWGEIDIICKKQGIVHFVEVKTMSSDFGVNHETLDSYRPEDNLHVKKLERIHKTVFSYIDEFDVGEDWQIDLITVRVSKDNKRTKVALIQNIV